MLKYLKFSLAPLTILVSIFFALKGGNYIWYFFFALLLPWLYRKMMAKKLKDWDQNYASEQEKKMLSNLAI